jgi:5-methylcytosine-specific restriction enzyme A
LEQLPFIPGKVYKRTDIHNKYGGSGWGGIAVSAKYPYIFIFSLQSGEQHGYKDQWENDDVFSYTSEGQIGDMQFIRGNLALRDHVKSGKRIFLFTEFKKAYVKFDAELEFVTYDFFQGQDREGHQRNAIKFFFKRVGRLLPYFVDDSIITLAADAGENDLIIRNKRNIPNETERKGLVTSRVGQGAYRKSVLFRWKFKCAVTNYSKQQILIASHIVPWKEANNEERLDVNNGILLSPTYDALFDRHLISFENNGKIILSDSFSKTKYQELGVTGNESVKQFSNENHSYLERHRQILK